MTNARKRAKSYDEIKPLISMCRQGRLFDVQQWIEEGKPIDSPLPELKRARKKGPLEIAIEAGFHSLAQIFLEAGAIIIEDRYNPLEHALRKKRIDIIDLLVKHGADIHSVKMSDVFETWDPEIMRYFIDRGADVETGEPMAGALIDRIRTSLGIYKQYADKFSSFPDQLNMALRWHAKEGNEKWVSLLLWAGADPTKPGPCDSFDDDEELYETAIELAFSATTRTCLNSKVFKLTFSHQESKKLFNIFFGRRRVKNF
jgi:ankyrin repeat protein